MYKSKVCSFYDVVECVVMNIRFVMKYDVVEDEEDLTNEEESFRYKWDGGKIDTPFVKVYYQHEYREHPYLWKELYEVDLDLNDYIIKRFEDGYYDYIIEKEVKDKFGADLIK